MDSATELSVAFLRSHAAGAAPVLEALAPEDAAAFLAAVPDDDAGRVLDVMQPLIAAAIVSRLTPKKAAAVLLTMDVHSRTRIVRVLHDAPMKAIMDHMPKGAARDLARYLRYPEGSVGAWMSSNVAVFEKSTAVRDCLAQLRTLPDKVRNLVFVTESDHTLCGAVELAELLSAPDGTAIGALADSRIKRLSPYARLTSVVALKAWDAALLLPVVDTKGRLLGALQFDRVRDGLASEPHLRPREPMAQIVVHLAEALLVCAAGMLQGSTSKPVLSRSAGGSET